MKTNPMYLGTGYVTGGDRLINYCEQIIIIIIIIIIIVVNNNNIYFF